MGSSRRVRLEEVPEMEVITEEEAVAFYDGWMEDVDSSENAKPVVDYESGLLVDALEERVTMTERTEPAVIFNHW